MEQMVRVKIPVNYLTFNPKTHQDGIVYSTIAVLEQDLDRYKANRQEVEKFLAGLNNRHGFLLLRGRIASAIDRAKEDADTLAFLSNNQWLLRFASHEDISKLYAIDGFKSEKVLVDIPTSVYTNGETVKIFYSKKEIPIWEKYITKRVGKTIKWLFLDQSNTFEERLSSILLSRLDYINSIVLDYPWVLMHLKDDKRRELMTSLNIPFSELSVPTGLVKGEKGSGDFHLSREMLAIPDSLKRRYARFTLDIYDMFSRQADDLSNKIFKYCYEHSSACRAEDENELLRQNLWILDAVDTSKCDEIYRLLGIPTNQENHRLTSLTSDDEELEPEEIKIPEEEYDDYQQLNHHLLALFAKGLTEVDEQQIVDFIESDARVLKLWPWLINYIHDSKIKTSTFDKKPQSLK